MKVFVIGTRGFPCVQGGVERHCEELYPRLVKLGCDITVITRAPYIAKDKRVKEWRGVKFIHLWCPRRKSYEAITHSFLGALKARLSSSDILHIHGVGPAIVAPLAKASGIKIVMTHHGPDYKRDKWGALAKGVLQAGERAGVSSSEAVIAIAEWIKDDIKKLFGKDAFFIPNGVPVPSRIPPGEALKKFGIEKEKYIFSACRFVPEKGLHDLIEAYGSLDKPAFKLVIAGDADHETEYSRSLKKKALAITGVVLTGFLSGPKLGELFSNAGLFVLPSYYEGLPIALLEALSYGIPVLVSDIPQHRDVPLSNDEYFKTGDTKALAKALMTTSGQRGRYISLVKEKYNWDNIAYETLKIYRSVLKNQTRGTQDV